MPAPLNELLEEATAEVMRLSLETKETAETIDHVVDRAENLVSGVVADGERAYAGLEALVEDLIHADDALHSAVDPTAATAFHKVMDRAHDLRAQAVEFAQTVAHGVTELGAERSRIQGDFDSRMQAAGEQFQHVAQQMADLEKATAEHLHSSHQTIEALQTAAGHARDSLAEAKDRLLHELDQTEAAARAQTGAYLTGIHELLKRQTHALVDLANGMVRAHNHAVIDLRQKFAETIPQALHDAADDLKVAMDALKRIAEERTAPLEQRSQAITRVAADAVEALQRIRTAAAQAGAK